MNINVERFMNPVALKDLWTALNTIPVGRSVRLARIPVVDYYDVIEKAVKQNPYLPFRPVIFNNIPIDMTTNTLPEFILVADDNTNIERTVIKETEFYKG